MDAGRHLIIKCLKEANIPAREIRAIGITGQRQGIALLNDRGEELMLSPNIDLRASFEGLSLEEQYGDSMHEVTGHSPLLLLAPAKVHWLRENRPNEFQDLCHILTLPAWLVYRLTGNAVCETTLATAAGLLDVKSGERPLALLSNFGVSPASLPPLVNPGATAGYLDKDIASSWGLSSGIPVTLAGADTQCGLLGMGLMDPLQTGVVCGWSCAAQSITNQPLCDIQKNCWTGCYLSDGLWTLEANLGDAGNAHRWLKEMLMGKEMPWEYADSLAEEMEPGSGGVTCFVGAAPVSATKARLKRGAIAFPTPLSYQETNAGQVLHAFYESLAYSLKANIGSIEKITQQPSKVLNFGGGTAQSSVLAQTIANVLGRPLCRSTNPDVSALGASMAAATAAGLYSNLHEACKEMASAFEIVEPETVCTLEYQELFEQWKSLYQRIQDN
jgi:sugar (pentulose or hexulose) kinase